MILKQECVTKSNATQALKAPSTEWQIAPSLIPLIHQRHKPRNGPHKLTKIEKYNGCPSGEFLVTPFCQWYQH